MEKAALAFTPPNEDSATRTTMLWSFCERVAAITKTDPKRWLKRGIPTLQRALIAYEERRQSDLPIKNKAAYLTWLIKNTQ